MANLLSQKYLRLFVATDTKNRDSLCLSIKLKLLFKSSSFSIENHLLQGDQLQ